MDKKLITKEEAKKILFNSEIEETGGGENLKSEIKFLRELVEKLSKGTRTELIETIRYVDKPYYQYPWWKQYEVWCGGSFTTTTNLTNGTYATYTAGTNNLVAGGVNSTISNDQGDFSSIKTF